MHLSVSRLIHSKKTEAILEQMAEGIRKYFRVELEGMEHIPQKGKVLLIANHSGFVGADAVMICHMIHHEMSRIPKILAHRAYFESFKLLKKVSKAFGLEEASVDNAVRLLQKKGMVLIFPEGEAGNFKSTAQRYHLQKFHTGFMRMAVLAQAPVIPCLVIGAEESNINLGNIDLNKYVKGLRIPIPANFVPLPAKWRIKFLEPIDLSQYTPEQADDRELMTRLSRKIQRKMQIELRNEVRKRSYVYFPVVENSPLAKF